MIFRGIFLGIYVCLCPPPTPPKFTQDKFRPQQKQINPNNRMTAFQKRSSIHYESFHHHQSSSKDLIVMAINYYQFSSMVIKYHHKISFMAIIKCIIFPMNSVFESQLLQLFWWHWCVHRQHSRCPQDKCKSGGFFDEQWASVILLLWVLGGWSHDL